jgi:hypothetical protein
MEMGHQLVNFIPWPWMNNVIAVFTFVVVAESIMTACNFVQCLSNCETSVDVGAQQNDSQAIGKS